MGISDFTAPLIDPMQGAQSILSDLVGAHRNANDELNALMSELIDGGGVEQFLGTAADAFGSAINQLTSLSEQRMGVFDQIIGGLGSCADGASSAVDSVLGAGLDEGLLGRLLEHFDLIDVILNGESVVQAAISALEQTLMDEISNPLALLSDLVSAVADMLGGLPITMIEWASEIYSVAQEVMQVINMVSQVFSMLSDIGNPIQDLFGALPGFANLLPTGGIMGVILSVGDGAIGVIEGAATDAASLFGGAANEFASVLEGAGMGVVSDLGSIGNDVLSGISGLGDALDTIAGGVLNDLGSNPLNPLSAIPMPGNLLNDALGSIPSIGDALGSIF